MKQTRGKVVNSLFLEVRARWFSRRSTLVKCQTIKGLNGWYFLLCVIKTKWDQSSLFFPALNSLWDCGSSECLGLCFGVERNCNTFTCIMFLYVTCNISHNCLFTCLPTNKMSVKRERERMTKITDEVLILICILKYFVPMWPLLSALGMKELSDLRTAVLFHCSAK